MTYPYPPLVGTDPEQVATRMATVLGDAWDRVQARYEVVLLSANQLRRAETLQALQELLDEIAAFQNLTVAEAQVYATQAIPALYARGAQLAVPGEPFTWSQFDIEAAHSLAADSYDDLLRRSQEAGRTGEVFARAVRNEARRTVPFKAVGRRTAVQTGRELEDRLRKRGISVATYADGSRHTMRSYTQMAVRTKAAVASNLGALNRYGQGGVAWVEVFDGADCGWASHGDPDKANGTVRPLEQARGHLLSHPQCRRAFGGRPDVANRRQAEQAEPTTTPVQREGQAQVERAQRAAQIARAARRARRQARTVRA